MENLNGCMLPVVFFLLFASINSCHSCCVISAGCLIIFTVLYDGTELLPIGTLALHTLLVDISKLKYLQENDILFKTTANFNLSLRLKMPQVHGME